MTRQPPNGAGRPLLARAASTGSRITACALRALAACTLLGTALPASPAVAAPDLVVESIQLDPDHGPNGTGVSISIKIRNQGDTAAAASTTRVRINQDPAAVSSGDTVLCSSLATPAMDVGATVDVSCTPTITGRPSGANYIWVIADVNKSIGQTNVGNDRSNEQFTVDGGAADLVVQSIQVSPLTVANGASVTITLTLKNEGSATAQSSTTRVRINQSASSVSSTDTALCSIPTATIGVNSTLQLGCTATVSSRPAGTNYVWALADVNKTAGQDDTTNDRLGTALEISGEASDLVVEDVTTNPTSGPNGKSVTVTATIRNQGTAGSLESVTRVRINQNPDTVSGTDPSICEPIQTRTLAIGQSTEISCKATIVNRPPGVNYIWVVADSTDTAGQSDRSNDRNKAEFAVDEPLLPDLTVRSLSVTPTSGSNGKTLTVTARIANEGDVSAPATKTRILINQSPDEIVEGDAILCNEVSTVALSSGASVQVSCKPVLADRPVGPHFIWAVTDATGVSLDANYENNRLAAAFEVVTAPAPDLVVESVAPLPVAAPPGETVTVSARIRNLGVLASTATTARFQTASNADGIAETDPVICDAVALGPVAAGAAVDIVCPWVVGDQPAGPLHLWVTADVANTAGQLDRTNDLGHADFTVLSPDGPDLVVEKLVVRPNTARNGDAIVVRARVTNVGNESAGASLTTFRINQDPEIVGAGDDILCSGVATQALAPTVSVRVRCRVTVADRPIGPNQIWAIVDTTETSGQIDTGNDRRRAPFTVISSDCTDPLAQPELAWPIERPLVIQDYATFGSVPLAGGKLGYHSGIDLLSSLPIAADQTPVYAAADGDVVATRRNCPSPADPVVNPPAGKCAGGWGNYVVIRHGAGVYSIYAHLGEVFARAENCVEQGERIAIAGSSGSTSIPAHLHFDVMADLVEPVSRSALGNEYYRKLHPYVGSVPENETGRPTVHLDPRDFMTRLRVRITQATTASRGEVAGGTPAYLAEDQEYVSYGELVPGFHMIDLPSSTLPQDGPPYGDGIRYGWVAASRIEVLETGIAPGSVRIDGYGAFLRDGVGANPTALRSQPDGGAAEISRAWGSQQFSPVGAMVTETGTGTVWQSVNVPGTSASGAGKPAAAWLPVDALGAPPAH